MILNKRNILLHVEAILLLGPISLALCYTSVMTLFIGIPSLVSQSFNGKSSFDIHIFLGVIGNIAGVFAIVILWEFVKYTLKNKKYPFSLKLRFAIAAGLLASTSVVVIYKTPGLIIGVLPVLIISVHFIFLQNKLKV